MMSVLSQILEEIRESGDEVPQEIISWLESSKDEHEASNSVPEGWDLIPYGCDSDCDYCHGEIVAWDLRSPSGKYYMGIPE